MRIRKKDGRFVQYEIDSSDGLQGTKIREISVTSTPTARFPKGFLVVQDDMDDTSPRNDALKKQNFKVIDWREIESALKL